ncbi:MAG: hypothetical protein K8F91_01070 [Candidatus Obscuribacterales bacterium]|nr:hypothetical protein [Candidatus Obscuribacterales bacterium]
MTSSTLNHGKARKRSGLTIFRLPPEHGALVVLLLSSILALSVAIDSLAVYLSSLLILWLFITTTHRPILSWLTVTTLSTLLWLWSNNPWFLAVFIFCCLGNQFSKRLDGRLGRIFREIGGLFLCACLPVGLAGLSSGTVIEATAAALSFSGAAFAAAFIVHAANERPNWTARILFVFALVLWMISLPSRPLLIVGLSIPVVLQLAFLGHLRRLSFKQAGVLESVYLIFAATLIVIS